MRFNQFFLLFVEKKNGFSYNSDSFTSKFKSRNRKWNRYTFEKRDKIYETLSRDFDYFKGDEVKHWFFEEDFKVKKQKVFHRATVDELYSLLDDFKAEAASTTMSPFKLGFFLWKKNFIRSYEDAQKFWSAYMLLSQGPVRQRRFWLGQNGDWFYWQNYQRSWKYGEFRWTSSYFLNKINKYFWKNDVNLNKILTYPIKRKEELDRPESFDDFVNTINIFEKNSYLDWPPEGVRRYKPLSIIKNKKVLPQPLHSQRNWWLRQKERSIFNTKVYESRLTWLYPLYKWLTGYYYLHEEGTPLEEDSSYERYKTTDEVLGEQVWYRALFWNIIEYWLIGWVYLKWFVIRIKFYFRKLIKFFKKFFQILWLLIFQNEFGYKILQRFGNIKSFIRNLFIFYNELWYYRKEKWFVFRHFWKVDLYVKNIFSAYLIKLEWRYRNCFSEEDYYIKFLSSPRKNIFDNLVKVRTDLSEDKVFLYHSGRRKYIKYLDYIDFRKRNFIDDYLFFLEKEIERLKMISWDKKGLSYYFYFCIFKIGNFLMIFYRVYSKEISRLWFYFCNFIWGVIILPFLYLCIWDPIVSVLKNFWWFFSTLCKEAKTIWMAYFYDPFVYFLEHHVVNYILYPIGISLYNIYNWFYGFEGLKRWNKNFPQFLNLLYNKWEKYDKYLLPWIFKPFWKFFFYPLIWKFIVKNIWNLIQIIFYTFILLWTYILEIFYRIRLFYCNIVLLGHTRRARSFIRFIILFFFFIIFFSCMVFAAVDETCIGYLKYFSCYYMRVTPMGYATFLSILVAGVWYWLFKDFLILSQTSSSLLYSTKKSELSWTWRRRRLIETSYLEVYKDSLDTVDEYTWSLYETWLHKAIKNDDIDIENYCLNWDVFTIFKKELFMFFYNINGLDKDSILLTGNPWVDSQTGEAGAAVYLGDWYEDSLAIDEETSEDEEDFEVMDDDEGEHFDEIGYLASGYISFGRNDIYDFTGLNNNFFLVEKHRYYRHTPLLVSWMYLMMPFLYCVDYFNCYVGDENEHFYISSEEYATSYNIAYAIYVDWAAFTWAHWDMWLYYNEIYVAKKCGPYLLEDVHFAWRMKDTWWHIHYSEHIFAFLNNEATFYGSGLFSTSWHELFEYWTIVNGIELYDDEWTWTHKNWFLHWLTNGWW